MSKRPRRSRTPREPNEEEKNIIISVRHCARELDDILQGARRKAESNARVFAESAASTLFRGLESYADMYEKLKLKSREALNRLFQRAHDLDDMLDAQDAIEETEGCWRNFLSNVDREIEQSTPVDDKTKTHEPKDLGDYIDLAHPVLVDCQSNNVCTLETILSNHPSLLLIFQPAYLPDTAVRWRFSEISKIAADFHNFNVGFAVITWGPEEVVRAWSKHLAKHISKPILWDREQFFCSLLDFNYGCSALWAAEMLDFCGCQRSIFKRSVEPPPPELNWLTWKWVGGEVFVASPRVSRLIYKKELKAAAASSEGKNEDSSSSKPRPKLPESSSSARICLLHRASNIADVAPSGSVYQAALTCHAASLSMTEAEVMDEIRMRRRLATPPESARLQYEAPTDMYYDPETELHYDAKTGYFYDAGRSMYYYWSKEQHRYVPANDLVQSQFIAAQNAQIAAMQAAAMRSVVEQEAARAAGAKVAAQLAAIRAQKDEYASYAYATCVLPQEPELEVSSRLKTASSSIEQSLGLVGRDGLSASVTPPPPGTSLASHSDIYPPGCPPPPGV
ncbi:hypothetical protein AAHC03_01901 [Spirometra sp. Aus1]